MKKLISLSLLLMGAFFSFAQTFQLAPPIVKMNSAYFKDSTSVDFLFNQPGASLHYTFQNRDPLATDPVYNTKLQITKPGTLRVKAIGEGFTPSETIKIPFYKTGINIDSISTSAPQEYYANRKPAALNDAVGGIVNYRANSWTGYNSDTVVIECFWKKPVLIQRLELGLLKDEASWIFLPRVLEVQVKDKLTGKWKMINRQAIPADKAGEKAVSLQGFSWKSGLSTNHFRIMLVNWNKMPEWHPSKGERAWIFLDEIIIR